MKIGVIGSGNIGGNLGKHWATAGHEVLFTSRHPEELGSLVKKAGENTKAVSVTKAFEAKADAYLLAMPFKEIDTISEKFAGEYANSIIIDATNPYPERDGEKAQEVRDANYNASEYTAMKFSTARTAKAFNTIPAEELRDRAFGGHDKLAIPFAAQDLGSKNLTKKLIQDMGFDAVYVGNLSESKMMDPEEKIYGTEVSKNELLEIVHNKQTA
jgi:predicted dinucleotide-binding enzyme